MQLFPQADSVFGGIVEMYGVKMHCVFEYTTPCEGSLWEPPVAEALDLTECFVDGTTCDIIELLSSEVVSMLEETAMQALKDQGDASQDY